LLSKKNLIFLSNVQGLEHHSKFQAWHFRRFNLSFRK
jgi:hypothetical protein